MAFVQFLNLKFTFQQVFDLELNYFYIEVSVIAVHDSRVVNDAIVIA